MEPSRREAILALAMGGAALISGTSKAADVAKAEGPKPDAGFRWPTGPSSTISLPQSRPSSMARSFAASGSLSLTASLEGNGSGVIDVFASRCDPRAGGGKIFT